MVCQRRSPWLRPTRAQSARVPRSAGGGESALRVRNPSRKRSARPGLSCPGRTAPGAPGTQMRELNWSLALGDEPEGETKWNILERAFLPLPSSNSCSGKKAFLPLASLIKDTALVILARLLCSSKSTPHHLTGRTGCELLKQVNQEPCLLLWEPHGPKQSGTRPRLSCQVADSHKPRCLEQQPPLSAPFFGSKSRVGFTGFSTQGPSRPKPSWWPGWARLWSFWGGTWPQAHSSSWQIQFLPVGGPEGPPQTTTPSPLHRQSQRWYVGSSLC